MRNQGHVGRARHGTRTGSGILLAVVAVAMLAGGGSAAAQRRERQRTFGTGGLDLNGSGSGGGGFGQAEIGSGTIGTVGVPAAPAAALLGAPQQVASNLAVPDARGRLQRHRTASGTIYTSGTGNNQLQVVVWNHDTSDPNHRAAVSENYAGVYVLTGTPGILVWHKSLWWDHGAGAAHVEELPNRRLLVVIDGQQRDSQIGHWEALQVASDSRGVTVVDSFAEHSYEGGPHGPPLESVVRSARQWAAGATTWNRDVISRRMARARVEARACYEQVLRRRRNVRGTVTLTFIIQPDGSVTSPAIGADDILDASLNTCLLNMMGGIRFSPWPPSPSEVSYPFAFTPE